MKEVGKVFILLVAFLMANTATFAQHTTTVVVRAIAKDAKFIGDGMGGAMITILNAMSGDTLAHGLTRGATGNTDRLVVKPVGRYDTLSTPGAAKFEAEVRISKPTLVTIKAVAPYGKPDARVKASVQKWIIPGKDITGDGVILEIPGFVVSNQQPVADSTYAVNQPVQVRTHLVMMCGCPTSAGGLWDSSTYDIKAQIRQAGELVTEIPLSFTGKQKWFEGTFTPSAKGTYTVWVYAFDPATKNTGVDRTTITVK